MPAQSEGSPPPDGAQVSVRPAGTADWPRIERLLLDNRLPVAGARDHLANFVVAVENGEVVGCAGAEAYGDVALGRSVAVAPTRHRRGLGRLLVDALLADARRRGVRRVCLLTTTAAEYFAAFGFEVLPIGNLPAALSASEELRGACPSSAAAMCLEFSAARPLGATVS